jgi:hypothetical protein
MDEAEFQHHLETMRALHARLDDQLVRMNARLGIPPPTDAATRHAFLSIALLCKRALEQPPHSTLHRRDVLDIARLCKRWLDPPKPLEH